MAGVNVIHEGDAQFVQVVVDGEVQLVRVVGDGPTQLARVVTEGPQGPPGADATAYVHQQPSASATWTINHNLGYRPSVELLNTGSQEIEGDVVHTSVNQTVVTFTSAVAGQARLI